MARYSIEGFVTDGAGGLPASGVVVVFSRETFTVLGQSTSSFEDGHYYIEFFDHPGAVFVVCFHSDYGTDPGVPPYFSLTAPPLGAAEIHDNITPVAIAAPPM